VVEGELLLGRFTVGERLGRGGYGTVHRAWDERLCRDVAIKAIEGPAAGRVLREAHAAARLNHPGVVTMYELGAEHGVTYLVSELVRGPNLREYAASGDLSDRDLAELGAELCAALAHAHAQGVIHRDIKPDNVLVRRHRGRRMRGSGERAMLTDFGIAAVSDEPTLTATGQVVGTLAYMAPEQAAGEEASSATDVYSLALMMYELWSGANPLAGPSPAATAKRIGTRLQPLADVRPELPFGLTTALDAALDPDPAARPTLAELHHALESVAGELHPDRAVPEPERPAELPTPLPEAIPARPFAVLLAAGAIACLGLLVGSPGLALVVAALLAPAALLLSRPSEWLAPAAAPLLGLVGLAPAFIVYASMHRRPAARISLAALGWAWTAIGGIVLGRSLGVAEGVAAGWVGSGPDAVGGVIAPLLGAEALAAGLIWVGAAIVLGLLLDVAGPALLAVLGMVWAAGLVAALGTVGGAAGPSPLLAPALIATLLWLAWDRAGRPELAARIRPRGGGALAALLASGPAPARPPAVRRPRHPAGAPLPDPSTRARRAASRHVDAALHGAGSRAGLP
jgi:eukaryotic-like serine/threonine-protein kinase